MASFDKVLPALKRGKKITRKCWGKRLSLEIVPDIIKINVSYVYGKGSTEHGINCAVFYKFSQDDILADDWLVL